MNNIFLRILNQLVFRRLEVVKAMEVQEREATVSAHRITQKNYRFVKNSGLDMETINTTLFRGQP